MSKKTIPHSTAAMLFLSLLLLNSIIHGFAYTANEYPLIFQFFPFSTTSMRNEVTRDPWQGQRPRDNRLNGFVDTQSCLLGLCFPFFAYTPERHSISFNPRTPLDVFSNTIVKRTPRGPKARQMAKYSEWITNRYACVYIDSNTRTKDKLTKQFPFQ